MKNCAKNLRNFFLTNAFYSFYYFLRGIKYRNLKLKSAGNLLPYFQSKFGIEIGGPSLFYDLVVPIYHVARKIDGVNFSRDNIWSKILVDSKYQYLKHKNGNLHISEMTNLSVIPDRQYDFLISSNVLEHTTNPLLALRVWGKKVKVGGIVFIVVPNKDESFDRHRPITTIEHLRDDLMKNLGEDDLTHLSEVLEKTDRAEFDNNLINGVSFEERMHKNHIYRSMHHHVFDENLLIDMCRFSGLEPFFSFTKKCDTGILCRVLG